MRRPLLLAAVLALAVIVADSLPAGPWRVPFVRIHFVAAGEESGASFGDSMAGVCPSEWQGAVEAGEIELRWMVARPAAEDGLTAIANCDN